MKREVLAAIQICLTLAENDGYDTVKLAKKAKLSLSTVYRLKNNPTVNMRVITLFKLARAVGLTVEMQGDGPRLKVVA